MGSRAGRYVQKAFQELTPGELHDLLRLRTDVFVVEQACPYPEVDGRDPESVHLLRFDDGEFTAYCRWYEEEERTVLGRIVVAGSFRGEGIGRELVEEALTRIGPGPVFISAQSRLEAYYRNLGFRTVGDPYDDFGVLHVPMIRDSK